YSSILHNLVAIPRFPALARESRPALSDRSSPPWTVAAVLHYVFQSHSRVLLTVTGAPGGSDWRLPGSAVAPAKPRTPGPNPPGWELLPPLSPVWLRLPQSA